MRFNREGFKDSFRKQESRNRRFNDDPEITPEPPKKNKNEILLESLRDRNIVERSELMYEDDGTTDESFTVDYHYSPGDFFADVPAESFQDPKFWSAVLSDPQMRDKFFGLHSDERKKYINFIPESIRMNPEVSKSIIVAFNLEQAFRYMRDNPEEFTSENLQDWKDYNPELVFLFDEYCRDKQS